MWSVWRAGGGGGRGARCLVLHLNFQHLFPAKILLLHKQEVYDGETFIYVAKPVNKFAFLIVYMWILVVRNMTFLYTPCFPSSQSLSNVHHNQQLQHPLVSLKHLYILWAGYQWHTLETFHHYPLEWRLKHKLVYRGSTFVMWWVEDLVQIVRPLLFLSLCLDAQSKLQRYLRGLPCETGLMCSCCDKSLLSSLSLLNNNPSSLSPGDQCSALPNIHSFPVTHLFPYENITGYSDS